MATCKLTNNVQNNECRYTVSGIRSVYLANFAPEIGYTKNNDGVITAITLPEEEEFFRIDPLDNSASWSDELAVNGNGGKYRTHTLNLTIGKYDADLLNQADALSLGRFIAVVVDKSGRVALLGGTNGLSATSFNYASGAADGDAGGWTGAFTGTAAETAPLIASEAVITPLHPEPEVTD
jgi:hypothetical protein